MPTGINRQTGEILEDWDYVWQALNDIWGTATGTRVERRPYGAGLVGLIDSPGNPQSVLRCLDAAVECHKWQPWFRIQTMQLDAASPDGQFSLIFSGLYYPYADQGDYTTVETLTGVQVSI
jgi:phage baseplate assembly protein W